MHRRLALSLILIASIAGAALAQTHEHGDANAGGDQAGTSSFYSQMMQAMERMDAGMMSEKPSGDPDHDFATMMIPHHQGAVDMAKVELIYGRDPVLRRLAEGIIVEQQQEIELMQRSLKELPSSKP